MPRPGCGVARRQGGEDHPVILQRGLGAVGEAEEPHAVHVRLVLADQRPGECEAGEMAYLPVELVVERVKPFAVGRSDRLRLVVQERREHCEIGVPEPLGRDPQRLDLDRGTDEARLQHGLREMG